MWTCLGASSILPRLPSRDLRFLIWELKASTSPGIPVPHMPTGSGQGKLKVIDSMVSWSSGHITYHRVAFSKVLCPHVLHQKSRDNSRGQW